MTPPPLPWSVQTQPERLILLTSAALAFLAGLLILLSLSGLSLPGCGWKIFTGVPCAGCGGTRSLVLLAFGDWRSALEMNPGAVVGMAAVAAAAIYAAAVLVLRLPPWRPAFLSGGIWRWAILAAFLANWSYLLWSARV